MGENIKEQVACGLVEISQISPEMCEHQERAPRVLQSLVGGERG